MLDTSKSDEPLDAVPLCGVRGEFLDSDPGAELPHKALTCYSGRCASEGDGGDSAFLPHIRGRGHVGYGHAHAQAVAKVVMLARCFGLEEPIVPALERKDYLEESKLKIEWCDPEEMRALFKSLVKDAQHVVGVAFGLGGVPEELKQVVGLLHRVPEHDIEERDSKMPKIQLTRKVARDRVLYPSLSPRSGRGTRPPRAGPTDTRVK